MMKIWISSIVDFTVFPWERYFEHLILQMPDEERSSLSAKYLIFNLYHNEKTFLCGYAADGFLFNGLM